MSVGEILSIIAAVMTPLAGGAVAAGAQLWKWIDKRIVDCESDRKMLHGKVEELHSDILTVSKTVSHLEGQMSKMATRQDEAEHKTGEA